jgi:tetratricopeptide (TPR) repeat protein
LERLATARPGDPDRWLDLADGAMERGRLGSARAALDRAAGLGAPASAGQRLERGRRRLAMLWLEKAEAAARHGDRRGSREALAAALAERHEAEQLDIAVRICRVLGDGQKELALLQQLAASKPDQAAGWIGLAAAAVRGGRREAALAALDRATPLSRAPGPLREAARIYRQMGECSRELAVRQALVDASASDGEAWEDLACAAAQCGPSGAAVAALKKVRELSQDPALLRRAAQTYEEVGESGLALELRRRLAQDSPRDIGLCLDLAQAAARLGRGDVARESLDRARRIGPGPADMGRFALAYQDLKDYASARGVWDRLIRENGPMPAWLAGRAVTRSLSGDRDGALADLREAVDLDPRYLPAKLSLVTVLDGAGRKDEARQVCRSALERPAAGGDEKLLGLLRDDCRKFRP